MTHGQVTDADVARLVERVHEAAQALIGGDLRTYTALMQHADDYTLLAPSGGEPRRGFDRSDEALDAMAEFFESGAGSWLPTPSRLESKLNCARPSFTVTVAL